MPPSDDVMTRSTLLPRACLRTFSRASWTIRKMVMAVSGGGLTVQLVFEGVVHPPRGAHDVVQVAGKPFDQAVPVDPRAETRTAVTRPP